MGTKSPKKAAVKADFGEGAVSTRAGVNFANSNFEIWAQDGHRAKIGRKFTKKSGAFSPCRIGKNGNI